jgi:hypothetical protein
VQAEQPLLVVHQMVILAKQQFMEWLLLAVAVLVEELLLHLPMELLVAVAQVVVLILLRLVLELQVVLVIQALLLEVRAAVLVMAQVAEMELLVQEA